MTRKKLKLKKGVWIVLVLILFLSVGIYSGVQIYKDFQYKKTYEYKLTEYGYSFEQAKVFLDKFDDAEIDYFLSIPKDDRILDILNETYYLEKNLKKYIDYMNSNENLSLSDVVRDINVHLDNTFYKVTYKTDTSLDYKMLVNKYYALDENYAPDDLVGVSTKYAWGEAGSKKVRKVAYDAFLEMWNAANSDGYYLMINSAYRSYQSQTEVYNDYKSKRGEKYADSIAARPGSSEHQTGLSIDIFSKNNSNQSTFGDTMEALWLKENAYKYGFVLRYPEDKVNVTGYNFESWHYRYVGVEAATYCYEHNITYDEYYAYFIEK
ncbi:MAG: M15 family metallopeptidase [Bacilli bacterium]|nr:M15 family metallopeptidase [Bacilli bacterium]